MKVPDSGKIINIAMLLGMVVIMFVIYKILAGLGIIKTAAAKKADKDKAVAAEDLRTGDYFDPLYQKGRSFKSLGTNVTNLYAQNLHDAIRGLGTDEEMIYTTFGKLFNKVNISEIAASYFIQYERDLQSDILGELTSKEKVILMNIINELPEA